MRHFMGNNGKVFDLIVQRSSIRPCKPDCVKLTRSFLDFIICVIIDLLVFYNFHLQNNHLNCQIIFYCSYQIRLHTKEHQISIEVYQKIATINNHIALTALGGCYEIGRGVEKNMDLVYRVA
jgi:hypothetical protein